MPVPNDRDATGSGSGFRVTDRAQRRRDAPISGPFSDHPGIPPPGLSAYRVDPILGGAAGPVVDPEVAAQLADPPIDGGDPPMALEVALLRDRLGRLEQPQNTLGRVGQSGSTPAQEPAAAENPAPKPPTGEDPPEGTAKRLVLDKVREAIDAGYRTPTGRDLADQTGYALRYVRLLMAKLRQEGRIPHGTRSRRASR
jgi:hypothetical protein